MDARCTAKRRSPAKARLASVFLASFCLSSSAAVATAGDAAVTAVGTLAVTIDLKVPSDIGDGTTYDIEPYVDVSDPVYSYSIRATVASARVTDGALRAKVDIPYRWALSSKDAQVTIYVDFGYSYPDYFKVYRTIPLPPNGTTAVNFVGSF